MHRSKFFPPSSLDLHLPDVSPQIGQGLIFEVRIYPLLILHLHINRGVIYWHNLSDRINGDRKSILSVQKLNYGKDYQKSRCACYSYGRSYFFLSP
ncbi:hypothetical protein NIES2119_22060 [[Phormidium ambiguum] IAM M-71]|uniref:Uncharacterized protein n=1 Tax=[Phormidium ambiguum] IAM M-71 TaxID=454136 RepID=A0A1U7IAZ9_9CYAN|nr:hypothetical protein NIES2119_22060 [Phormidium ambiguum IAM M-71]